MRWATSDHHWGHRNILRYCAETRKFPDVDEMNAQLIARWNDRIGHDDDVYLVGDVFVSRRMTKETKVGILRMLNGRKTLIKGNHDDHLDIYHEAGFVGVHDHLVIDGILLIHRPPDKQHGREEWELARKIQPKLIVHGHTHAKSVNKPKCLNVCVDWHDLHPVSWTLVEERLRNTENEVADWE
jgi:calcineurin-like phosphoesterase family protein